MAAIDINGDGLASLVAEFGSDRPTPIIADLSTPEGARESIDSAAVALGGIDILWAHAGMPGPTSVENLDLVAYRKAIDLNVTAAVLGAGQAAPHKAPQRRRRDRLHCLGFGFGWLDGRASFTLWAVVGLTKSLSLALASDKNSGQCRMSRPADTPMKVGFHRQRRRSCGHRGEDRVRRAARPASQARRSCLTQCSGWCQTRRFVTGVALPVDGGFTAR